MSPRIPKLAVLMLAVLLLVVQGFVTNRLAGIDYPLMICMWDRTGREGEP